LSGKAISALYEETIEILQETFRILKGTQKPKYNLTGVERRALQALKANETLTVLPGDKGNTTMIMDTTDCIQMVDALQEQTFRTLEKDPTESMDSKIVLLLRKFPLAEKSANNYDCMVSVPQDYMVCQRFI
jgi:hypothetical protein